MTIINLTFFFQEGEFKWVGHFPQVASLTTGTFVSPSSQGPLKINPPPNPSHPPVCPQLRKSL